jgi:putative spermidine/putrescine transport system ATP-binding protein
VGVSNILERDGRRISVRPERIALDGAGEPGRVATVTFVGAFIRYAVALDRGETLTVVRQNDGIALEPGAHVRLGWRDEDAFEINPPGQEVR